MYETSTPNSLEMLAVGRVFRVIVLDERKFSKRIFKSIAKKGKSIPDSSARTVTRKMNFIQRMRFTRRIPVTENTVLPFYGTIRTVGRERDQEPLLTIRPLYDIFIQYEKQPYDIKDPTMEELYKLDEEDRIGNMFKVVMLLQHYKLCSAIDFETFANGREVQREVRTLRDAFIIIRTSPELYSRGSSGSQATVLSSIRSSKSRKRGLRRNQVQPSSDDLSSEDPRIQPTVFTMKYRVAELIRIASRAKPALLTMEEVSESQLFSHEVWVDLYTTRVHHIKRDYAGVLQPEDDDLREFVSTVRTLLQRHCPHNDQ